MYISNAYADGLYLYVWGKIRFYQIICKYNSSVVVYTSMMVYVESNYLPTKVIEELEGEVLIILILSCLTTSQVVSREGFCKLFQT